MSLADVRNLRVLPSSKCHDEGPHHDCAYVNWRNSLIPVAEALADAQAGEEPPGQRERVAWSKRWDAAFHRAMQRFTTDPFSVAAGGVA